MKKFIICLLGLTSVAYGAVYSDFTRLVDYQSAIDPYHGASLFNLGDPDYALEFYLPPMDYQTLSRDWQLDHESWAWEVGYTGYFIWSEPNGMLGIEPPVLTPHSGLLDCNHGDRLGHGISFESTGTTGMRLYEPFPVSGSFYLGATFNTGGGIGWVQLDNSWGSLQLLSSAISVNEDGIIVGTTQAIPEPSSAILIVVISGLGVFARRRFLIV